MKNADADCSFELISPSVCMQKQGLLRDSLITMNAHLIFSGFVVEKFTKSRLNQHICEHGFLLFMYTERGLLHDNQAANGAVSA